MPLSEQQRLQRLEDKVAFIEEVLSSLRAKLIKARLDILESHENGERQMSELPSDEQLRVIADDVRDPTRLIATELLALRAENARLREALLEIEPNTLRLKTKPWTEWQRMRDAALLGLRATDG